MLIVTYKDGQELTWHVEKNNRYIKQYAKREGVERVTADGDELVHIRMSFENLPSVPGRMVVTYSGDFAQFIVDNLGDVGTGYSSLSYL